jgi:origin recognition complex subunit 1
VSLEDNVSKTDASIDIAGVPGTGKTATVRSVMTALRQRAEDKQIKPFRFLEINGMKITDPAQSFSILWEFISGKRSSPKQALAALETHFKTPSLGRDTWSV